MAPAARPHPFCCSASLAQAWDHAGTDMYGHVCYRDIHIPILGRLLGCLILFQTSSETTAILASRAHRFLQKFMRKQASKTIWCGLHPSAHRHPLMGLLLLLPSFALRAASSSIPALVFLQNLSVLLNASICSLLLSFLPPFTILKHAILWSYRQNHHRSPWPKAMSSLLVKSTSISAAPLLLPPALVARSSS